MRFSAATTISLLWLLTAVHGLNINRFIDSAVVARAEEGGRGGHDDHRGGHDDHGRHGHGHGHDDHGHHGYRRTEEETGKSVGSDTMTRLIFSQKEVVEETIVAIMVRGIHSKMSALLSTHVCLF
ncbi:hypothetical protein GYMLUDRAFT_557157 [Collybiopsis luxurians FD-317 M1]|uniref:Uncharacterized protein n=1 Tax=Collybiopsis luxurians FD-317 M1 TaxID=944289 RepID=A0A0D0C0X1_9AGAR|nr:hypothetical protein GYMLUDRAFT_557157 [Collybiopsis luxurians FD-317 M1]